MSDDVFGENQQLKVREQVHLAVRQNWPAFAVIGFGVFLLLSQVIGFHLIDLLWPGFVIAPGVLLLMPAHHSTEQHQSRAAFLAVPGAMIATAGLLLFAMNVTDHFEAWAYSWTLLVAAVPAALMYIRRFDPTDRIHQSGYKMIRTMFYLFLGFAIFFEIIIFENFNPVLPILMIVFGIYLLRKQRREAMA